MSPKIRYAGLAPVCISRTLVLARAAGAALLLVLPLLALMVTPVRALGDGGSSSSKSCQSGTRWCPSSASCVPAKCRRGTLWSSSSCRCVSRSSQDVSEEDVYDEAVRLAEAEQYRDSLDLLQTLANQQQARVLTYIGFTTRKLGDLDKGIAIYQKALALEPDYTLAREYLGEGLLDRGDLEGAKRELTQIERVCGKDCHPYEELAQQIALYETRNR